MRLFDTHCHLAWEDAPAPAAEQIARARAAGVEKLLTVAIDASSAARCRALAAAHAGVLASAGVHPNDLGPDRAAALAELRRIEELLAGGGFAAVGETGLDFHRDATPPEFQREALRLHLELARRHGLPVILHCREAAEALLEELVEAGPPLRGVLHCWSDGPRRLEPLLELGLHVSFAGNLTYPRSDAIRAAAAAAPADRLLVETDAPFLSPQPVRGRPNEPAHVLHTARRLAEIRGVDPEALAALCHANACALFGS